jgi:hypothetical protein
MTAYQIYHAQEEKEKKNESFFLSTICVSLKPMFVQQQVPFRLCHGPLKGLFFLIK